MRLGGIMAAVALAVVSRQATAQGGPQPRHVRGVVVSLAGDALKVETGPGRTEQVKLAPGAQVAQVEDADPGALAQGAFIGTTAVPRPDGTLEALEVHVFPEAMRGAGEGHRPWDRGPTSSMTNATVSGLGSGGGGSSMTNATVSGATTAGGTRTLTLTYPGGRQTVRVPPNVPIVKLEPGDRSLLTPGAHVFAIATPQPDGTLSAQRLLVGKGAVVPPM